MAASRMVFRRFLLGRSSYWLLRKQYISTSNKNKETAEIAKAVLKKKPKPIEVDHPKDDWITYGFSYKNEFLDRFYMAAVCFLTITGCMVFGGFCFVYQPDARARDWLRREGFLELHRREKLGLPHVDPDLVPRSRIVLPTEEELGETDVII